MNPSNNNGNEPPSSEDEDRSLLFGSLLFSAQIGRRSARQRFDSLEL